MSLLVRVSLSLTLFAGDLEPHFCTTEAFDINVTLFRLRAQRLLGCHNTLVQSKWLTSTMKLPVKVFSRKNTTLNRRCTSHQIINSPSCGTDCEITCGLRGRRRREWIIVGTNAKLGILYRYCDLNRLSLAVLLHSSKGCKALLVSLRHGLKRKQCIHQILDDHAEVCAGPDADGGCTLRSTTSPRSSS